MSEKANIDDWFDDSYNHYDKFSKFSEHTMSGKKFYKKNTLERKPIKNISESNFGKIPDFPMTMPELIGFIDIFDLSYVVPRKFHKIMDIENKLTAKHLDIIYNCTIIGNCLARDYCHKIAVEIIYPDISNLFQSSELNKKFHNSNEENFENVQSFVKIITPKIASFFTLVISNYVMDGNLPNDQKIREITYKFISHIDTIINEPTESIDQLLDWIGNILDKNVMMSNINFYDDIIRKSCEFYIENYFESIVVVDIAIKNIISETNIVTDIEIINSSNESINELIKKIGIKIDLYDTNLFTEAYNKYIYCKKLDSSSAHKFEFDPNQRHVFPLCDYMNFIFDIEIIDQLTMHLLRSMDKDSINTSTKYYDGMQSAQMWGMRQNYESEYITDKLKKIGYKIIDKENVNWINMLCKHLNLNLDEIIAKIVKILKENRDDEGIHNKYDTTPLSTAYTLNMIANDIFYEYDDMIDFLIEKKNFKIIVPMIFQLQIFSRAAECDITYLDPEFNKSNIFNSLVSKNKITMYNTMTNFYLVGNIMDNTNATTNATATINTVVTTSHIAIPEKSTQNDDPIEDQVLQGKMKYYQDRSTSKIYNID